MTSTRHPLEGESIMDAQGFGISNGVITILALLAGFCATHTPKIGVIGALFSLLLTDPIGDSYSIYISMKHSNPDSAKTKLWQTWMYQSLVQLTFLVIVILSPTLKMAFVLCSMVGVALISYDFSRRLRSNREIFMEGGVMVMLILFTFSIDSMVYRYMHTSNRNK
jgi:hypothetical protein